MEIFWPPIHRAWAQISYSPRSSPMSLAITIARHLFCYARHCWQGTALPAFPSVPQILLSESLPGGLLHNRAGADDGD
jgi:hypothetical protein